MVINSYANDIDHNGKFAYRFTDYVVFLFDDVFVYTSSKNIVITELHNWIVIRINDLLFVRYYTTGKLAEQVSKYYYCAYLHRHPGTRPRQRNPFPGDTPSGDILEDSFSHPSL